MLSSPKSAGPVLYPNLPVKERAGLRKGGQIEPRLFFRMVAEERRRRQASRPSAYPAPPAPTTPSGDVAVALAVHLGSSDGVSRALSTDGENRCTPI